MSIFDRFINWMFGDQTDMQQRPIKLEMRRAKNGEYYIAIVGGNGEVMFTSETYSSRHNCERARRRMAESMRPGHFKFTYEEMENE